MDSDRVVSIKNKTEPFRVFWVKFEWNHPGFALDEVRMDWIRFVRFAPLLCPFAPEVEIWLHDRVWSNPRSRHDFWKDGGQVESIKNKTEPSILCSG